jgi:hypothetical protein
MACVIRARDALIADAIHRKEIVRHQRMQIQENESAFRFQSECALAPGDAFLGAELSARVDRV